MPPWEIRPDGAATSLNGCHIEARSAESAEKVLVSNSVVFVVDALWPRSSLSADDKPAWLGSEKAAYQAGIAWTWKRHGLGDRVVLFGQSAKDFARAAPAGLVQKDAPFVFNYNRNGGFWATGEEKLKPHKPLAVVTAERVVTVHGADGIGEAMRLLTSMSPPGAAGLPAGRVPATGEPR